MNAADDHLKPPHPSPVDDELLALEFQLEELGLFADTGKGKNPIDCPSNAQVVISSFQAEIENYQSSLRDQKLAQSIGAAVDSDGLLIANLTQRDLQTYEDSRIALDMSNNDPTIEAPPENSHLSHEEDLESWSSAINASHDITSFVEFSDDESETGPSKTYTERQADVLKKLSTEFVCTACTDRFPRASMVFLACSDRYCATCINELFTRSICTEDLYPPKCCRQPIPLELVARHMDEEKLAAFQLAQIEYSTTNKTYCSNQDCGVFIIPDLIDAGTQRATCGKCSTETCAICNNAFHEERDCPSDKSLQETKDLARSMGWQTCYMCDRLIELRSGCNHMRCHCGAEFCYVCGERWKNCPCDQADPERIEERAIEIVNRNGQYLPQEEHRRRVNQVYANLQENHECQHSRRFQRITGPPRRGFRCEMCDARHYVYILQCRRCDIRVCEECRRHRV